MSFYLGIKDKDNNAKHYEVPEEVYVYVRQLENSIRMALVDFEDSETPFYRGMKELSKTEKPFWETFGYPTKKGCDICGKTPAKTEPRFGYASCEVHASVPPAYRHIK